MAIKVQSIPLQSRLCTNSEPITSVSDKPSFEHKNSIAWNQTIRNAYITTNDGYVTTTGTNIKVEQYDKGASLKYNDKTLYAKFNWLLSEKYKIPSLASGECIAKCVWEDKLYSLWDNTEVVSLIVSDKDGSNPKQTDLDCNSAIISSVYKLDQPPMLFTVKTTEVGSNLYDNHVAGFYINDLNTEVLSYDTNDYIPLGDANSATVFKGSNGRACFVLGCDDIDHNRSKTLIWYDNKKSNPLMLKWFGCVSPTGIITGEPIPDPDIFKNIERNANGTYSWDMYGTTTSYIAGQIIGGYTPPVENKEKFDKIIIDSWTNDQWVRYNMSANDTKLEDDDVDPKRYYVSNFADNQGIYYDYGQGWLKTYVRKCQISANNIIDCYIYTYGAKRVSNLPYRKESIMAKGTTAIWPFTAGQLSTRVYTVGGNNKSAYSILPTIPFTVEIIPSDNVNNIQNLDMQVYGLAPLSFSWKKSLLCAGAGDNGYGYFVLQYSEDEKSLWFSVSSLSLKVEQTSDIDKFKIEKLADYMFLTNILDEKNLLVEDHSGNLNLERTAIPYNMECILQIEDAKMTPPSVTQTVANNTFNWAAAFNDKVYNGVYTNNNTTSTSYLLPPVSLPMYINPSELSGIATAVLENKGCFVLPLLKGLFNEYEGVNVYYTITSQTSTLNYMTTNVIKETDVTKDRFDLYGKKTYEVSKRGTSYTLTTYIYPVAIGTFVENVNYIQPTVLLEENYAVQLYMTDNHLFAFYLYANRIFNGSNVFTIYGSNYYYDGQAIYFIGKGSNYSSNEFVCYALGLKFLANSGAEAFFYSDFEKRIFIFTGSNTMQPADLLSSVGLITDAMFSSKEQMLYLLTDDNRVVIRSTTDTCALDDVPDGSHLEGTDDGAAIVWDGGYFVYSPFKGTSYRPFSLETEYLGNDDALGKCSYADVLLYRISDKPINVTLYFHTLNGIEDKVETKKYSIGVNDWHGRTYRMRISPKNSTGNAFKVGIESKDEIAVSYIGFATDKIGTGAARR